MFGTVPAICLAVELLKLTELFGNGHARQQRVYPSLDLGVLSAGKRSCALCRAGGRVLLLGSQPENVTLLHFAEYLAEVPDKRSVRYPEIVQVDGERRVVEVAALDNSRGIVDWPEDYFATITTAYVAARGLAPRPVGAAPSFLLDARDLAQFGADWMECNLSTAQGTV